MKNYIKTDGHIYVVEYQNVCKIGYSENPGKRIRQIQCALPYKVQRVFVSPLCPDVMSIESKLHILLRKLKTKEQTEWFNISFENAVKKVNKQTEMYKNYQRDKMIATVNRLSDALKGAN